MRARLPVDAEITFEQVSRDNLRLCAKVGGLSTESRVIYTVALRLATHAAKGTLRPLLPELSDSAQTRIASALRRLPEIEATPCSLTAFTPYERVDEVRQCSANPYRRLSANSLPQRLTYLEHRPEFVASRPR